MNDNPSINSPRAPEGGSELSGLLRLAVPLIAGQAGAQLMSTVDTAMVGRLGPASLGGAGIGNALFFSMCVLGMGAVMGMDPPIAQAVGAGEHAAARRIFWQGLRVALWASVPVMALIAGLSFLLELIGIEPETAHETRRFLWSRMPNVPTFLVYVAARSYLQSAGGARVVVYSMILANIINFFGNYFLIYGDAALQWIGLPPVGLPALGVVGSGLSSSLASIAALIVIFRGVQSIPAPPDPYRRAADPALLRKILTLGVPIGFQLVAEVGAFTVASLLAGRMGKVDAAAFQVAITLASFTFTVTLGLASATAVRVGQAVGRGDTPGARRAGFTALKASTVFMSMTAIVFIMAPAALARLLTDKVEVIAAAATLVQVAGFFQLSDGAQVVASGALRGAGDTRSAPKANLVGYYLIGLPIAIALAFGLKMGGPGVWWGLSVGLTVVAVGLTVQFHRISKRPLARV